MPQVVDGADDIVVGLGRLIAVIFLLDAEENLNLAGIGGLQAADLGLIGADVLLWHTGCVVECVGMAGEAEGRAAEADGLLHELFGRVAPVAEGGVRVVVRKNHGRIL